MEKLAPTDQAVLGNRGGTATTPEQYALLSTGWDVRPVGEPPHATTVQIWRGESKTVLRCTGTAVSVRRGPEHLRTYNDWLKMAMPIEGSLVANQGNRTFHVSAGELVSVAMRQQFTLMPQPGTSMFVLYLSAESLLNRGMMREEMSVRQWSGGPLLPTLAVLLEQLFVDDGEVTSPSVESALFEVVAAIVATSANGPHSNGALRARATGLIGQHFQDPQLNADWLAERLCVSRRTLYGAAHDYGVSIADMIRMRRVRHARLLLRSQPDLSLHRVARLSGFGGPDQLSRAFRSLMGIPPGEYRRTQHTSQDHGGGATALLEP